MIERPWRICGPETLGIQTVEEHGNPYAGTIPVTPMMDTQLDQILIQGVLQPLRTRLLRDLDDMVTHHRAKDFFEIFLTIFVLLCNCESRIASQISFARRYGFQVSDHESESF